jgi:cobalt-zinc-cadmium efflux system outer membrane protein
VKRTLRNFGLAGCLILAGLTSTPLPAQPPESLPPPAQACDSLNAPARPVFTIDSAIVWALQNNPEIAAIRQRHGIAAASVVIARTYPFNPVLESEIFYAQGPRRADVTTHVPEIYRLLTELEVRHQGRYRRQEAYAALSRTDWEIAFEELRLAGDVASAFNTVVYRRQKLQLQEEAVRLNERTLEDITHLRGTTKTTAADVIVARTELEKTRALFGAARALLVTALNDLRRQMGIVGLDFDVEGTFQAGPDVLDLNTLTTMALEKRADLKAKAAAVAEARAALDLTRANRYGNPTAGPAYEMNETSVNFTGAQLNLPIPIFNKHRGDILKSEAELYHAGLELRQNEIQVQQDVRAAVDRLNVAIGLAQNYQTQFLPSFEKAQNEIQELFTRGLTDIFRLIDVRRKLIDTRNDYLDALFEVAQARAKLAVVLGELGVATDPSICNGGLEHRP